MKPSQIYRKAAESLVSGVSHPDQRFSCFAIDVIGGAIYGKACLRKYVSMFCPRGEFSSDAWASGDDQWGDSASLEGHQCRVLALLFMSEIAKDSE